MAGSGGDTSGGVRHPVRQAHILSPAWRWRMRGRRRQPGFVVVRSRSLTVGGFVFLGVVGGMLGGGPLADGAPWWQAAVAVPGVAAVSYFVYWRPVLIFDDRVLIAVNPVGFWRIPWEEIERVSTSSTSIDVKRRGRRLQRSAWAVQEANFQTAFGMNSRAKSVAALIMERAEAARLAKGDTSDVASGSDASADV